MKNVYYLLLIFFSINLNAQEWDWFELASGQGEEQGPVVQGGAHYMMSASDYNEIFVAISPNGGMNIFGEDYGDFSFATHDIYFKLDEEGNTEWSTVINSTEACVPMGLSSDNMGNAYAVGTFQGDIEIDENTTLSSTNIGAYYLKLDNDGNIIWAKTVTPTSSNAIVYINHRFEASPNGDIISYILFNDTISWNNTQYISSNPNFNDALIIKMDTNGQTQWVRQFQDPFNFSIDDILFDENNDILISGNYHHVDTIEIELLPEFDNISSSDNEAFIMKWNGENGQSIWYKNVAFSTPSDSIVGTQGIFIRNTETDELGNIYQLNRKWGLPDINIQGNIISDIADREYFISKYDPEGNWLYSKTVLDSQCYNMQMSIAGSDIIIASTIQENIIFEGIPLNIAGNSDMIISAYDLESNYKWHYSYGTANTETFLIRNLDHGANGNLYIHGNLESDRIFAFDDITVSSTTGSNQYIGKYNIPYTSVGLENFFPKVPSLYVSPNPTSNYLNIDLSDISISNNNSALEIYNALGKKVYETNLNNSQNEYQELSVQHLAKGIYFIKIRSENEIKAIAKFIKQ